MLSEKSTTWPAGRSATSVSWVDTERKKRKKKSTAAMKIMLLTNIINI